MSYLERSDGETVDSKNKVSRFIHESQCEVNQGVTQMDQVALCQMLTLRQVRTLSVTH